MRFYLAIFITGFLLMPAVLNANYDYATTTLIISICGNSVVDEDEQCDVPGETGMYSQTIAGRQCNLQCKFGPYCGDGILQTSYDEECDDGNNNDGDFCSSICKIEPAGSGGGGSSGGASGGGGGSNKKEVGDTIINVTGKGYPLRTVNFLLDSISVGSVRSDSSGKFEFATKSNPGTVTLGVWALDNSNNRSITLNNTFDVTQGAITNVNGLLLPPTIIVDGQNIDPGAVVNLSGQAVPDATVEVHVDNDVLIETTTSGSDGSWVLGLDTSKLSIAEHTVKARVVTGVEPLTSQSTFSSSLQLFVGVEGKASSPSDLNRDGLVNLIDFSILIFWWQTDGGDSDPSADINGNGKVSLEDFSILLFNWTG